MKSREKSSLACMQVEQMPDERQYQCQGEIEMSLFVDEVVGTGFSWKLSPLFPHSFQGCPSGERLFLPRSSRWDGESAG